ncbi:hypothetical protein A3860_34730 [Niastella vici]|uniref:Response regulatory domain-containing protein n=1 Tax=Niastella vici TaxID=1703345 RepID=A0A1V9FP56_9BACT|nr:response regulator [Niastella vici]OQP60087.1 hypothetical protein A3860_34730 [Niastella vici]
MFRESIVEVLSLNGFQVVLQLSDKTDLLQKITNELIPDVCLIQLNIDESEIEDFIKYLRTNWPRIRIVLYSLELELDTFEIPLFGADAVLTNSTSLIELEKVLGLETVEDEILN